jgi:hypothetical protein
VIAVKNHLKKSILLSLAATIIFTSAGCVSEAGEAETGAVPAQSAGYTEPFDSLIIEEISEITVTAAPDYTGTLITAPPETAADKTAETTTAAPPIDLPTDGKVLNLYGFNEEFKNLMSDYYLADRPLSGIDVNWIITAGTIDYRYKLDMALVSDENAPADIKTDLFIAHPYEVLRYTDTPYTLSLKDLGITEEELGNQYPYTKSIAKDSVGTIKASAYDATPEIIAYRRSIAKDVLGVSEPEDVRPYLQNKTAFDETAGKMVEKGYKMVAAYESLYENYIITAGEPIVPVNSTDITIPDAWEKWVDDTKLYTEKGYNNKIPSWLALWEIDMTEDNVFCYQGAQWFIDYTLMPRAYPIYGDFAVVPGPVNTFNGGTFLLAGANTDNADIVADIMRYFTTDRDTMGKIAMGTGTFVNNSAVNAALANEEWQISEFFGGQNPYGIYNEVAGKIDPAVVDKQQSKYAAISEYYRDAFTDYFNGEATKEECLQNFYNKVYDNYPELD